MLFRNYIEKWKRYCRKGKDPEWKKDQDKMISNHILPIIGHVEVANVDEFLIADVLQSIRDKGLSTQTERHIYSILNSAFRAALARFKLIKESPVLREIHISKVINKTPLYLTPEKAWMLLDYTKGDSKFGMLVWLQTLAGIRVGEAIGLRWENVDFEANIIHIRDIWNKKGKKTKHHRKNGSTNFTVPMIPALRKYLLSVKDKTGHVAKDDGKRVSYEGYKTYLRRIGPKLKLEIKSSHGLRHTSTEVWMSAGASREHIRMLLGQETIRSTERYIHRPSGELDAIAEKIRRPKKSA